MIQGLETQTKSAEKKANRLYLEQKITTAKISDLKEDFRIPGTNVKKNNRIRKDPGTYDFT